MSRSILLALALLGTAAGCKPLQAPPVELSFRDSLVGAGEILQIVNSSDQALTGIEVTITAPSGESRSFTHDRLGGYKEIEVGWKKLGGWQVPLGSEVEIGADGYLLTFKGRLPEPEGKR